MDQQIQALCDFLERLLHGSISADDAREMIGTLEALSAPRLAALQANLFHYIDDADIRKKDATPR